MLGPSFSPSMTRTPGPDQQPQQPRSGKKAVLGTRGGHADAIMRPIHVFVGDDDDFVLRQRRSSVGFVNLRSWSNKLA